MGIHLSSRRVDAYLFLNQDVMMFPTCMEEQANLLAQEQIGVVGAKLLYPETHLIQHAGGSLNWEVGNGFHIGAMEEDADTYNQNYPCDYVTGACLLVKQTVVDAVNGFDDRFAPAYYEDVDLCLSAKKHGWETWYCGQAQGIHVAGASFSAHHLNQNILIHINRLRLVSKHFPLTQLQTDYAGQEISHYNRLRHPILEEAHRFAYFRDWRADMTGLDSARQEAFLQAIERIRQSVIDIVWQTHDMQA
jgi:GT2 family glycosyltransferase